MSIRPRHDKDILNGIKTLEIRRKFPIDYVGWVYIYNTKDIKDGYLTLTYIGDKLEFITSFNKREKYCGKVIARFWCDKVEHIEYETCSRDISGWWKDNGEMFNHKDTCLTYEEMFDYIGNGDGYAIHITKLEIFDKPKEISEFKHLVKYKNCSTCPYNHENMDGDICSKCKELKPLARVPQSWCYIEI